MAYADMELRIPLEEMRLKQRLLLAVGLWKKYCGECGGEYMYDSSVSLTLPCQRCYLERRETDVIKPVFGPRRKK